MKAIRYIERTQKGTTKKTYVGADDTATQAQYDLISVGSPGTVGALSGVTTRFCEMVNPAVLDPAGNAEGTVTASAGFALAPVNAVRVLDFGSPATASATAVHAAIALTASAQTGIATGFTNPDVPRLITVKGNAVGNAGNVTVYGTDADGAALSETIALNGATAATSVNAFRTVTSVDLPAETHAGTDTVAIGTSAKIGLGVALKHKTVLFTIENTTQVAAASSTPTINSLTMAKNVIAFATAPDGTPRLAYVVAE